VKNRLHISPTTLAGLLRAGDVLPWDDVYQLGEPDAIDAFEAALNQRGLRTMEDEGGRGYLIEPT
jgi:hypothetical protein